MAWLEEPLYPFDVHGHAELAASITTPLLHGANLYEPLMIRDMLEAGALGIVQPSDMKLGGLTRWMEVAELARVAGKKVVPAGWTMLQIDQHLAAATPPGWWSRSRGFARSSRSRRGLRMVISWCPTRPAPAPLSSPSSSIGTRSIYPC